MSSLSLRRSLIADRSSGREGLYKNIFSSSSYLSCILLSCSSWVFWRIVNYLCISTVNCIFSWILALILSEHSFYFSWSHYWNSFSFNNWISSNYLTFSWILYSNCCSSSSNSFDLAMRAILSRLFSFSISDIFCLNWTTRSVRYWIFYYFVILVIKCSSF